MTTKEIIEKILPVAVNAPSGDNAQPWEFEVFNDGVMVYNKTGADDTLYNYKERGSYLAHGALVENIVLLAKQEGYQVKVLAFQNEKDCLAHLIFTSTEKSTNKITQVIAQRTTNRKLYKNVPLTPESLHAITQSTTLPEGVLVTCIEDREIIKEISRCVSVNERLLMENKTLHDFLFTKIRWSKKEEQQDPGLYIKTMEFPLPVAFMFRYILHSWNMVSFLNRFGFSRFISSQSQATYAACSAILVFTVSEESNLLFFNTGRALERIWLTATTQDLSLHPLGAMPYLGQRVRGGDTQAFSEAHTALIADTEKSLETLAMVPPGRRISMICRVGYGPAPSAHAHKQQPYIRKAHA